MIKCQTGLPSVGQPFWLLVSRHLLWVSPRAHLSFGPYVVYAKVFMDYLLWE